MNLHVLIIHFFKWKFGFKIAAQSARSWDGMVAPEPWSTRLTTTTKMEAMIWVSRTPSRTWTTAIVCRKITTTAECTYLSHLNQLQFHLCPSSLHTRRTIRTAWQLHWLWLKVECRQPTFRPHRLLWLTCLLQDRSIQWASCQLNWVIRIWWWTNGHNSNNHHRTT